MSAWMEAMGTAINVVNTRVADLNMTAADYNLQLERSLEKISDVQMDTVPPPDRPSAPPATPPAGADTGGPGESTDSPPRITEPGPPDFSSWVARAENSLSKIEGLFVGAGEAPPPPSFTPIAPPTPDYDQAPNAPAIPDISLPTAPALSRPTLGPLTPITIPAFTFPSLPDFNNEAPSADGIVVPNVFINWAEPQYQSESLDDLLAWVKRHMDEGTGLPAPVEDALFARARERDSAEARRAVQQAVDTWAARGFTMPPGMLARQTEAIHEQSRLKAAELNRDILIEATKWELENIRFAVQQGIALEGLLQNLHENTAKRAFEAAKFQAEAQINVFNAQIGLFNARNAAFQTLATVFKTKLEGALARVQVWKTQMDGLQVLGQLNQQKVETYKAQMSALQSEVEIYATQMKGAQTQAEINKSLLEGWRTQIQAHAAAISAEVAKMSGYEAQMRGRAAEASVYDAQVRGYAARMQAIGSQADAAGKVAQVSIEGVRAAVERGRADTERYRAQVEDALRRSQFQTQQFVANVDAWKASAQVQVANNEMLSRYADMQTRTNIAFSEAQTAQYSANINQAHQRAMIALEGAKAVGQYTAQLAAGAMSALHVSASVQGSGSHTGTNHIGQSTNTNYNYNY